MIRAFIKISYSEKFWQCVTLIWKYPYTFQKPEDSSILSESMGEVYLKIHRKYHHCFHPATSHKSCWILHQLPSNLDSSAKAGLISTVLKNTEYSMNWMLLFLFCARVTYEYVDLKSNTTMLSIWLPSSFPLEKELQESRNFMDRTTTFYFRQSLIFFFTAVFC